MSGGEAKEGRADLESHGWKPEGQKTCESGDVATTLKGGLRARNQESSLRTVGLPASKNWRPPCSKTRGRSPLSEGGLSSWVTRLVVLNSKRRWRTLTLTTESGVWKWTAGGRRKKDAPLPPRPAEKPGGPSAHFGRLLVGGLVQGDRDCQHD